MKLIAQKDSWEELKAKLKNMFPELIKADLLFSCDEQEKLFKMVAYKLGKSRKELQEIIIKL
jgi:hypothetical protein